MHLLAPSPSFMQLRNLLDRCPDSAVAQSVEQVMVEYETTIAQLQQELQQERNARQHVEAQLTSHLPQCERIYDALQESEALYRCIIETATEGIWVFDADGNTSFANGRLAQFLGYPISDLLDRPLLDFVHPDCRALAQHSLDRLSQGHQEHQDLKFWSQDGQELWAILSATPIHHADGSSAGILAMITDITERKLTRTQLEQSFCLLQTILESTAEGILAIDTTGTILCMNRQFRQQWNLPDLDFTDSSQLLTLQLDQIQDAPAFLEQLQREALRPHLESQGEIELTDGRTLERWSKPLQLGDHPIGRVISNRDVTEQKRSQAALAESEQLLRTVVTHTPTILYAMDRQGVFTLAEGKGLEVAGFQAGELVGESAFNVYAGYPDIITHINQVLEGAEHNAVLEFNGVIYDNRATPLRNPQGEIVGLIGVAIDVTTRRQAEKALHQAKEDLELRVAQRTAALQAANCKLQQEISQRKLIEQNLREKQAGLRLLNRVSTGMSAGLSVTQLIELAIDEISHVFPDVRVLYGIIEHRYLNVLYSAQPDDMPALEGYLHDFYISQTYADTIQENCPIIVEDVLQEPWLAVSAAGMVARKTRAILVIPVQHSDQSRGLLCMNAAEPRQWDAYYVETLQEVANYLAIVLQKARAKQEQQQAEERLRLFESVVVNGNDAVIITDADCENPRIIYTNAAFTEVTGYSAEEVIGKTPRILQGTKTSRAQLDEIKAALCQGQSIQTELINYHKDGSEFWADLNIVPIADSKGTIIHFVALQRDITDRKWSEKALIATQARLKYLLSSNPSVIYTCQPNDTRACTFVSENITQQLGYEIWQYLKDPHFWMAHVHPDDVDHVIETVNRLPTVGELTCEYRFLHQDGHYCWLRDGMKLLRDRHGQPVEIIGSVVDISDRKWAEDQIRSSLQEKEVMLKEIHHRVKNNLQVISSLLKLQVGHIKDDRISEVLKESQNRVRAMALIHEKLYQSDDLAKTDFSAYIRRLSYDLFRSYAVNSRSIQLSLDIEDVRLSIDTAIPCGLIINELVSNSLKYAFTERSAGEIRIQLHSDGDDAYQLIVHDNGNGLPADLDFRHTRSLGLQLVCNLTKQLQGTIALDRSAGTQFTIFFAESKPRG